ncbi:uncharacterized protein MONOS_15989 [Monocercomonoides exilis]|uniref:uncharacterized protein n=1 Tax=Monocercomonoides exilis TaxID=2049356 RepID=UPI003559B5CC|nr:hypothetical protein MONOS_15989 [Monocercomonoides exilis]|eukprot:MONOS_15989.1-p1 / transcript=MONOS_15989.1 / gene=MONOS_15989 / organism=Monocercomonoides_exilis_PA203 / gene_product=unspecified product / transcript_product=unspecified product / location=Mono_scaffold01448:6571-7944(-) / protein_length=361 / sequence_SO=supercontig / SO=protein_coding / is_pseudo=false
MEKKPSLVRIKASSDMRSIGDEFIKALYAYDILQYSGREIEESRLISRGCLVRALKARKEGRDLRKNGRPTLFTKAEEDEFEERILEDIRIGINHTKRNIIQMANELLCKKRSEGEEIKTVDKHWVDRFLLRHKKISLQKPKPLPIGRAAHSCKAVLIPFFDAYEKYFFKVKPIPQLMFNIDETSTVFSALLEEQVASSSSVPSSITPESSLPTSTSIIVMTSADGCRYLAPVLIHFKTIPAEYLLATTSTEPNDQFVFASLKRNFSKATESGKATTAAERREAFIRTLKNGLSAASYPSTIIASWRVCGLFPMDKNAVLNRLPDAPPQWAASQINPERAPECASFGAVYYSSDDDHQLFA